MDGWESWWRWWCLGDLGRGLLFGGGPSGRGGKGAALSWAELSGGEVLGFGSGVWGLVSVIWGRWGLGRGDLLGLGVGPRVGFGWAQFGT